MSRVRPGQWAGWVALLLLGVLAVLAALGVLPMPHWLRGADEDLNGATSKVLEIAGSGLTGIALSRLAALGNRAVQRRRGIARVKRLKKEQAAEGARGTVIGGVLLEDLTLVGIADEGRPMSDFCRFRFRPGTVSPRPAPDVWPALEERLLPLLQATAEEQGRQFTDDRAVDLVGCRVVEDTGGEMGMTVTYELTAAPTSYYTFALTSNVLDLDLSSTVPEVPKTLRAHWSAKPSGLEDVDQLPAPAKVGVAVVVVTGDGAMVVARRSRQWQVGTSVGGRTPVGQMQSDGLSPVHFVAEGMTPDDRSQTDGRLEVQGTAVRALWEELGIPPNNDTAAHDLQVTLTDVGAFFDHQRWQPIFLFVATLDGWDFARVCERVVHAPHRHEHRELVPYPFTVRDPDTRSLLLGSHRQDVLASNHAKAALCAALAYSDGIDEIRRATSESRLT